MQLDEPLIGAIDMSKLIDCPRSQMKIICFVTINKPCIPEEMSRSPQKL